MMLRRITDFFRNVSWTTLACALVLSVLGVLAITSASPQRGIKQLTIWLPASVGMMLAALAVPYQRIGRAASFLFALGILVLGAMLTVVPAHRDTHRWIVLGSGASAPRIQPSELMKLAFILAMARYLMFRKNHRRLRGLIKPFLLTLLPVVLILRQPDLGTALLFFPVLFAMLFAAGARAKHLLIVVLLMALSLPGIWLFALKDYQKDRITVLFEQHRTDRAWRLGKGLQVTQSKLTLGSGQVLGKGWRAGTQTQNNLLPEDHTDFIFAVIGEEWGFAGCVLVLAAFLTMTFLGLNVAVSTNEPFGRLVAVGVVALLAAQTLINVGMTLGVAPITGMTLPFVSYGGSSLMASFIALGLLLNVGKRRPIVMARKPFEFRNEDDEP
jgi:rod shape-determining protein RodA